MDYIVCRFYSCDSQFVFQSTGLAPGGITGLAIIFSRITHIPVSYMSLVISVPLLIVATVLLGKGFGIKTLYITLITPACMELVPALDLPAMCTGLPWWIAPQRLQVVFWLAQPWELSLIGSVQRAEQM